MHKYTLYTYDLWADGENSYSVNDVYRGETVEAADLDEAIKEFGLLMDRLEMDNNVDNSLTAYFIYTKGEYAGSPACEIRFNEET